MNTWDPAAEGVVSFPSGRRIRGRGLRHSLPQGPVPDFAVYLLGRRPAPTPWDQRWVRWPDFWLPANHVEAVDALREAWLRAESERVGRLHGGPRQDRHGAGLHRGDGRRPAGPGSLLRSRPLRAGGGNAVAALVRQARCAQHHVMIIRKARTLAGKIIIENLPVT